VTLGIILFGCQRLDGRWRCAHPRLQQQIHWRGATTPVPIPPVVHAQAYYEEALADWREEAFDTFSHLVQHGIQLHIVSNTDFTAA
jgi:hypothetical protein